MNNRSARHRPGLQGTLGFATVLLRNSAPTSKWRLKQVHARIKEKKKNNKKSCGLMQIKSRYSDI